MQNPKSRLNTYRLLIEYEGTDFHGWQIQPELPTIQSVLESALATALRRPIQVTGSGRTDAGVHARGQVAHFKTDVAIDLYQLKRSLNGILPHTVAILDVAHVADAFHARYDARHRRYHYYITTEPRALGRTYRWYVRPKPRFDIMNEAATVLLGAHHFGSFCRTSSETENRVCRLERAVWVAEDRPGDWRFEIVADRFLHGMVRAIVGTLIKVGQARRDVADLSRILAARDRRQAGPAAPAHGLILETVEYADHDLSAEIQRIAVQQEGQTFFEGK